MTAWRRSVPALPGCTPLFDTAAALRVRVFGVHALQDIDYPEIEQALLDQILSDPAVHSRIDELYYEDHVQLHPWMHGAGPWKRFNNGPMPRRSLSDSYTQFARLRHLGIRAHSWV